MSCVECIPDRWVVVNIKNADNDEHWEVFGYWVRKKYFVFSGKVTLVAGDNKHFLFKSNSSNMYCYKNLYGVPDDGATVLTKYSNSHPGVELTILDEQPNWEQQFYK